MDPTRFDALTRSVFAAAGSRRGAIASLAGAALGVLAGPSPREAVAAPACPRCGACTACTTDGACTAGCPGGCVAGDLCRRAARHAAHKKLAAHLAGLGFAPNGPPEAVQLVDGETVVRSGLGRRYAKAGGEAWLLFQVEATGGPPAAAAVVDPARGRPSFLYVAGGKVKRIVPRARAAAESGSIQPAEVTPCQDVCATLCNLASLGGCARLAAACAFFTGGTAGAAFLPCAGVVTLVCGTAGNAVVCNRVCDAACTECKCAGPCSCWNKECCPTGERCCPRFRGTLGAGGARGECCPTGQQCCSGGDVPCCPPGETCCRGRGVSGGRACCPAGQCGLADPYGNARCCQPSGPCPAECPVDGPCLDCCSRGFNLGVCTNGQCDAPSSCGDLVCPSPKVCCRQGGAVTCCERTEDCCGGACVPGGRVCCPNQSTCAAGQACCVPPDPDPLENYTWDCCEPGETCCQLVKPGLRQGICCRPGETCTALGCCPPDDPNSIYCT